MPRVGVPESPVLTKVLPEVLKVKEVFEPGRPGLSGSAIEIYIILLSETL